MQYIREPISKMLYHKNSFVKGANDRAFIRIVFSNTSTKRQRHLNSKQTKTITIYAQRYSTATIVFSVALNRAELKHSNILRGFFLVCEFAARKQIARTKHHIGNKSQITLSQFEFVSRLFVCMFSMSMKIVHNENWRSNNTIYV